MSDNKCFCHLNGYEVKDANARERITALEDAVDNLQINAAGKLYRHEITINKGYYDENGESDDSSCTAILSLYNRNSARITTLEEIGSDLQYAIVNDFAYSDISERSVVKQAFYDAINNKFGIEFYEYAADGCDLTMVTTRFYRYPEYMLTITDIVTEV